MIIIIEENDDNNLKYFMHELRSYLKWSVSFHLFFFHCLIVHSFVRSSPVDLFKLSIAFHNDGRLTKLFLYFGIKMIGQMKSGERAERNRDFSVRMRIFFASKWKINGSEKKKLWKRNFHFVFFGKFNFLPSFRYEFIRHHSNFEWMLQFLFLLYFMNSVAILISYFFYSIICVVVVVVESLSLSFSVLSSFSFSLSTELPIIY